MKIEKFEVIRHGVEDAQYFQGCGVAFTEYDDVATGIGNYELEALEDALETLAQLGYDTQAIEIEAGKGLRREWDGGELPDDTYWYVSVRVKRGAE